MGYDFMVSSAIRALLHRATLVREDKERLIWLATDHAPGLSQWTGDEEERILQAVKTVSTKFNGDRGGHLMEHGMAPAVYNRMVQQFAGAKPETDVFASWDAPQLRRGTTALAQQGPCVVETLGFFGVGGHLLAWCSRRHQTYGDQDYCG